MGLHSRNIGRKFRIEKLAVSKMKEENIGRSDGIILPGDKLMRYLKEEGLYTYLQIHQVDEIKPEETKSKVQAGSKRRDRKVLENKLHGGNFLNGTKDVGCWGLLNVENTVAKSSSEFVSFIGKSEA